MEIRRNITDYEISRPFTSREGTLARQVFNSNKSNSLVNGRQERTKNDRMFEKNALIKNNVVSASKYYSFHQDFNAAYPLMGFTDSSSLYHNKKFYGNTSAFLGHYDDVMLKFKEIYEREKNQEANSIDSVVEYIVISYHPIFTVSISKLFSSLCILSINSLDSNNDR